MNIFLSYASEDRAAATAIQLAIREQGHEVFFDRDDLPPGDEYDTRIRRAIERADLFVFLISAESLDSGSYTLTELEIAEKMWKRPAGKILPVLLRPTPLDRIPAFLKSVTLLEPQGNVAASVADIVYRLGRARRRAWLMKVAVPLTVASSVAIGGWFLVVRAGPAYERTGSDGARAVLVPAGTFTMGDDEDSPRRDVYVDAFYLDQHEVTTSRYRNFLEATGSVRPPDGWEEVDVAKVGDLPVIGVDWHDASAYCTWAGKRLPTESEWEKAARGTDARKYPWGNEPPTPAHANFLNGAPGAYRDGLKPVGTHPAGRSPSGIDDLAGNAAEWVADWYAQGFATGDVRNPQGPQSGEGKVIRGGGWMDPAERITATKRFYANPANRSEDVGFRCARDQHEMTRQ
ncbi:MAG TPA: SUMF1/EgtB/PvdO family nonheme iron enzyme [Casimicrobiaceae bacterium]